MNCKQKQGGDSNASSNSSSSKRSFSPKKSSSASSSVVSQHTGIFTDGGSRGNPGRGGWGFVHVIDNKIQKEGWGGEDHTTNNRMELTAIIEALKAVGDIDAVLYSDSNLCVQTYNQWMIGWKAKGWKKKSGPISNLDLVQELDRLKQECPRIRVEWVKAHAGNRWNEYVDQLTQKY